MRNTSALLESLKHLLEIGPAVSEDFQVVRLSIVNFEQGHKFLDALLNEILTKKLHYEQAGVQLEFADNSERANPNILLPFRTSMSDLELNTELTEAGLLCDLHNQACQEALERQDAQLEFDPWERYDLVAEIVACPNCVFQGYSEVILDKEKLGDQVCKALSLDLPDLTISLGNLHISLWTQASHLFTQMRSKTLETHKVLSDWTRACIFIIFDDISLENSDYLHFISDTDCTHEEVIRDIVRKTVVVSDLTSLTKSRLTWLEEIPTEEIGYLPPEYWISSEILLATTGATLPVWFLQAGGLFTYAVLTTLSTRCLKKGVRLTFEIEREFTLSLTCSFEEGALRVHTDSQELLVSLDPTLLTELLHFYMDAFHGKLGRNNYELVQKAVVYGTDFDFTTFSAKIDRVRQFYNFEYRHLLGDQFKEQSQILRAFISDMVSLRERISSLVESQSQGLNGLALTVLAAAALSIIARVQDITTWDNLVRYGLLTTPVFAYLYILVFLSRIDNLLELGEKAVDDFQKDVQLGQQIWDFPLHTIGVDEGALDRNRILEPLVAQHRINVTVAMLSGMVSHVVFVILAVYQGLWWAVFAKLLLDLLIRIRASLKRQEPRRIRYYSAVWLVTAATALVLAI
jgi:hypothetical protein